MTTHRLKTLPVPFFDVRDGRKTFELRKNDRDYQVGDLLYLQCWGPETGLWEEEDPVVVEVTYLLEWPMALREGFVALGIAKPSPECVAAAIGSLIEEVPR